jgi:CRISPR-associated protein Csd1
MILQALTKYYETLKEKDEIAPRYYAKAGMSFGLQLDASGELVGIIPLKLSVQTGNKTAERPQPLDVPEAVVRSSGIQSNFLWDNAMYLLGLDAKGDAQRAARCFESAKELHLSILKGVESASAQAVRSFFENWQPAQAAKNPIVQPYLEELLGGGNVVFCGVDTAYSFEDPTVRSAWERYRAVNENKYRAQCLVTGLSDQPIAYVHPKVKGVQGGQTAGTSIVSANGSAFESYGLSANLNAPVSEYAAFAYTSALNHLIADFDHRMTLDGDTVVCWAENGEAQYQELYMMMANPRATTEKEVSQTMQNIVQGLPVDLDGYHPETPFYVLCLSPNAARVSVRFFLRDTFCSIAKHLGEHYRRLEIAMGPNERPYLSPYWMLKETTPPGSKDDAASPLLAGATLRAILSGAPYPAMLYESILIRIRADRKINRARAATIKAYLTKNILPHHPEFKEVLQVALNEQSTLKPYVLGRLFALLEQAQESANPGINATITDRYFDSACATPKLAFPTLLKLNRHHLAKDEKWGRRNEKLIGELVGKLEAEQDPYPARLSLEEQGLFILGYYHQKQARYMKKEEQNSEKENQ